MKKNKITYNEEREIIAISKDTTFEMRLCDWDRIKELIEKMPVRSKFLSNVYSILYGIAVTSFSTFITVLQSPDVNPFTYSLFICITIFSFFSAIVFTIIDLLKARESKKFKKDILNNELKRIEKMYEK